MKRTISAILAAFSALSFAACGTSGSKITDTTVPYDSEITESTETAPGTNIPSDAFYDGKPFRILCIKGGYFGDDVEKMDLSVGDILYQEKYKRLSKIEDTLGVDFKFTAMDNDAVPGAIRSAVNSGSDEYEMTSGLASHMASLVYEDLFVPVNDLTYIDLENPWWNKEYIESVSFDGKNPYILFGGINYNSIERTTCVFVNVPLLEDKAQVQLSELHETVLDGEWTIDKMYEMMSVMYHDENGNGNNDAGDTFGLINAGADTFNYMAFGAGLRFVSRDENGYPELSVNNDRTFDLMDKLLTVFRANENSFNVGSYSNECNAFSNGQSLFMVQRFFVASWGNMREMKQDYSIVPVPKFSEDIDNYHSVIGDLVQWHTVPVTAEDLDMISAVLETMAYEGYENLVPAYYDSTLKLKYTRGDDLDTQSRILDIITENARTDFLYINPVGPMKRIFKDVFSRGQNNLASLYASYESSALASFVSMREFCEQ